MGTIITMMMRSVAAMSTITMKKGNAASTNITMTMTGRSAAVMGTITMTGKRAAAMGMTMTIMATTMPMKCSPVGARSLPRSSPQPASRAY